MATITEDYVSFEVAKLLKEKGFDEDTIGVYHKDGTFRLLCLNTWNSKFVTPISAPTLQMAMKWLREVHNLHIMINCIGKVNYDPTIQRFDGKDFEVEGVEVGTTRKIDGKWVNVQRGFKTCEQAAEAAIKYCLENLI
jgi:hypothetical protein